MKQKNIPLWISTILATAYAIYLIAYFYGVNANADGAIEQIGGALATALVTPHIVMIAMGVIFSWLGIFLRASWSALVAAILYAVASVIFMVYIMFAAPIMIIAFVGYAKQKKINAEQVVA